MILRVRRFSYWCCWNYNVVDLDVDFQVFVSMCTACRGGSTTTALLQSVIEPASTITYWVSIVRWTVTGKKHATS